MMLQDDRLRGVPNYSRISAGLLPPGWTAQSGAEYTLGGKEIEVRTFLLRRSQMVVSS